MAGGYGEWENDGRAIGRRRKAFIYPNIKRAFDAVSECQRLPAPHLFLSHRGLIFIESKEASHVLGQNNNHQ